MARLNLKERVMLGDLLARFLASGEYSCALGSPYNELSLDGKVSINAEELEVVNKVEKES